MTREVVLSAEKIEKFFQKSLRDGTEGIFAKKLDGGYAAGSRDFNWIKYKKVIKSRPWLILGCCCYGI